MSYGRVFLSSQTHLNSTVVLLKLSMCNGAAEQVRQTLAHLLLVLYTFPVTATRTQRMDRIFHAVHAEMLQRNKT